MARAVLALVTAALAILPARAACSANQKTPGFYTALVARYGKPVSCRAEGGNLTYTFRHGVKLISRTEVSAEISEQKVEMVRMDTASALTLMKRAEMDAYKPKGCGISWTSGEEDTSGGAHEMVYRGDTCNCQGRLTYQGRYVVSLVLRSAC